MTENRWILINTYKRTAFTTYWFSNDRSTHYIRGHLFKCWRGPWEAWQSNTISFPGVAGVLEAKHGSLRRISITWTASVANPLLLIYGSSIYGVNSLRKNSKLAQSEWPLWLVELMAAYLQMWKEPVTAQSINWLMCMLCSKLEGLKSFMMCAWCALVKLCINVKLCVAGLQIPFICMAFTLNMWLFRSWKLTRSRHSYKGLTDWELFLDSMGGGAWPFLVGVICLWLSGDGLQHVLDQWEEKRSCELAEV